RLRPILAELLDMLRRSGETTAGDRLSMLPMLAALHSRIRQHRQHGHWVGDDPDSVYASLSAAITAAIDSATPLTERAIGFWSRKPDGPLRYRALHGFFAMIGRAGGARESARLADALLRKSRKAPARRAVRLASRLQPVLGPRLAGAAAATW